MSKRTDVRAANLIEWIMEAAKGEPIEAVVIGEGPYNAEEICGQRLVNEQKPFLNKVLDWETAKPLLDYGFYDGYGGHECNPIAVWSASWIIFVDTYDGSTGICAIPRNPRDHEPIMPGGG